MEFKDIILLALLIGIIVILILWNKSKKETNIKKEITDTNQNQLKINFEKIPYKRKNLMTKNEWSFYKQLKIIADEINLTILCKTRIADLVEVENGLNKSEWQIAFNKINKKHIDFILCKPENLYPLLLIELDDNSHKTNERKERDIFIEKILEKCGYKILRIKGPGQLKEKIINILNINEESI